MKQTPDGTMFLTRKEVMKAMGIGDVKSLELFKNPEFPSIRIGREWLVETNAFREFASHRHDFTSKVY